MIYMQVARRFGSKQWPARVPIGWTLPSGQRRAPVVAAHPSPPPGNPPPRSQPQHIGHTIEATTVLVASSWPISGSRVGRQQVGGGWQGALPSQRRPELASVGLLGGGGFPCCPRRRRPPRASRRCDSSDGVPPPLVCWGAVVLRGGLVSWVCPAVPHLVPPRQLPHGRRRSYTPSSVCPTVCRRRRLVGGR